MSTTGEIATILKYGDHEFEDGRYLLHVSGEVFDNKRGEMVSVGLRQGYKRVRLTPINGTARQCLASVHILIAKHFLPPDENPERRYVDHTDRNTSNNSIDNLRWCTRSENNQNCTSSKNSTSKFVGVHYHKASMTWVAVITCDKKMTHIGCFKTEEDAARARDAKAKELGMCHTINLTTDANTI